MPPMRSLFRRLIRFFRIALPLLLICVTILLTIEIRHLRSGFSVSHIDLKELLQSGQTAKQPAFLVKIHRTKLLSTAICPHTLFLLILVSTNVGNFDRRQLIRKTWGTDHSILTKWKTVYLLGKNSNDEEMETTKRESEFYGDMVQADYHEHFWNMSFKVAMGFEWSLTYCSFGYLLKSDDDVFVNTYGLLNFLTKYTTPRKKFYTGNIMVGSVVLRDGRYGVSPEEYNDTVYKPYCSGGGYVMSRDAVESIFSHFDVWRPLKIDDAYIGLLADRADIKVVHNPEFRMYEDKCGFKATTLVQHPARGDCAIKLYNSMMDFIFQKEKPVFHHSSPT